MELEEAKTPPSNDSPPLVELSGEEEEQLPLADLNGEEIEETNTTTVFAAPVAPRKPAGIQAPRPPTPAVNALSPSVIGPKNAVSLKRPATSLMTSVKKPKLKK